MRARLELDMLHGAESGQGCQASGEMCARCAPVQLCYPRMDRGEVRTVIVSGMHSDMNPSPGVGVTRSLLAAWPDLRVFGLDYSTRLDWTELARACRQVHYAPSRVG